MDFKVLAVGDVVGNPGLERIRRNLRQLKRKTSADFVVVNGENAAVVGITPNQAEDILEKQILNAGDIFSKSMHLENAFSFEEKFIEIEEEYRNHNLYYDVRCSTLLKDILIQTARLANTEQKGINRQKADEILQYVHQHYERPLTNKEIAEAFCYHENYISSLILKYTGLPLHQYVLNYKMHMAIVLLQSTNLSIGEVAEKVGMPDIKHFSKCFKKLLGHPPSSFKVK